ncbi:hypothetical protein T492DRAFT_207418 [Pavlovales sp. CCMP2436]|nr:hypothetical protein T492DRAFT_207418 [Pavlovales sp. CCMP2436]
MPWPTVHKMHNINQAAVEGATRNLEAAILSSFNGDELPEHIELCVRVWPRGSARTAASKVPSAADATAIVPATAEAELTEQLLTQDSSMRFVRLRFEVVLTGGSEEISTSGTVSMTPVMRHDSSDGLSAVIIVQMNDQTGNELAKALVRRRNDWAYKVRIIVLYLIFNFHFFEVFELSSIV